MHSHNYFHSYCMHTAFVQDVVEAASEQMEAVVELAHVYSKDGQFDILTLHEALSVINILVTGDTVCLSLLRVCSTTTSFHTALMPAVTMA